MEWDEKLQIIIDYIENHLQRKEEPIDNNEISKMAGCSFGFFQKVFSYMNGISFAEYIRLRKLTLAGYDLKSTDMKVVDISYKCGYDSPTSFTKAFQQFHGVSPKEARSSDVELKVCPKMQLFEQQEYRWKIERKTTFRLIGKTTKISCKDNQQFIKIPEFWSECQRNGIFAKLISLDESTNESIDNSANSNNPKGIFGICSTYDSQTDEIEYAIMVISDQDLSEEFTEIIIPGVSWAIFDCKGPMPQAIQKGWKYLNEEWLLKYPFKHAVCPELEWYSDGNVFAQDYLSQIWIPIIEEE